MKPSLFSVASFLAVNIVVQIQKIRCVYIFMTSVRSSGYFIHLYNYVCIERILIILPCPEIKVHHVQVDREILYA
jgi:hypothetical protein